MLDRFFRNAAIAWSLSGAAAHFSSVCGQAACGLFVLGHAISALVMLCCGVMLSNKIWKEKNGKTAGENGSQEV